MSKRVAIFGGSFNPPGYHHRRIAQALAAEFDEVIIIPCGPRPDKLTTNDVEPIHRATMADLTFQGIPNVTVELFDLENATFTKTHELQEIFADRGEIWHVVGTDLIQKGDTEASFIQRVWERGLALWQQSHFVVITRQGFECQKVALPPHHRLIDLNFAGSSSTIRERIFRRESIAGLVTPEVESYIERYGLYRGRIPNRATKYSLVEPRLLIVADEHNDKAREWAKEFAPFNQPDNPNGILVIGGDGTMLHAIRQYWRMRLPFLGVNAGHLGFLLNNVEEIFAHKFPLRNLILRQMPLLYVETRSADGQWRSALGFNDAWVERSTSQSAWIEIKLNDQVRLPKLVADGALLSTASGSTAYARAMGAMPLLADTPALILVGSNVMSPPNWKCVLLSYDSEIVLTTLDPKKRPIEAYVDGFSQGEVDIMRVRVSRIAAAELAFSANHDMTEKIAQIQFPDIT